MRFTLALALSVAFNLVVIVPVTVTHLMQPAEEAGQAIATMATDGGLLSAPLVARR